MLRESGDTRPPTSAQPRAGSPRREDSIPIADIGIYVLTYPGDYHLSTALIKSLRHFGCDVPIVVIPGEGVDLADHPFDVPVMPTPEGFWAEMGHADRKFWAFQGPFEKFIYMDSDIVCTRPLAPFISQIRARRGRFLDANLPVGDSDWRAAISDPDNDRHDACVKRVASQLGNVALLSEFDPEFDPYARYPFNSGLFASSRNTIPEDAFAELHTREREFFENELGTPFDWRSHRLFFGDQGRLNYLVDRLGIERNGTHPFGHYQWGGEAVELPLEIVLAEEAPFNFVHWAGTPRPSPSFFCRRPLLPILTMAYPMAPSYKLLREIPAYSVWRHFAENDRRGRQAVRSRIEWTWRDAKVIPRRCAGKDRSFAPLEAQAAGSSGSRPRAGDPPLNGSRFAHRRRDSPAASSFRKPIRSRSLTRISIRAATSSRATRLPATATTKSRTSRTESRTLFSVFGNWSTNHGSSSRSGSEYPTITGMPRRRYSRTFSGAASDMPLR